MKSFITRVVLICFNNIFNIKDSITNYFMFTELINEQLTPSQLLDPLHLKVGKVPKAWEVEG